MSETRIRTGVLIIIVIAAVGIGVYVGMGSSVIPIRQPAERNPEEAASDGISRQAPRDDVISEPATELITEQKKEIIIGSLDPGLRRDDKAETGSGSRERGQAQILQSQKLSQTPPEPDSRVVIPVKTGIPPSPDNALTDEQLKSALAKAAESEDYTALGTALADVYKRYPQGKKEFAEIESRAYVKATSYLDQAKNVEKARAAADAVYSKYPFGWRFKYLRVRVLERLGRDAFAAGNLADAEKHALAMLGMEFRPEGANLMADIYLKRIDEALAKGDRAGAKSAYDEIKDYEVSPDRRKQLDERFKKISDL